MSRVPSLLMKDILLSSKSVEATSMELKTISNSANASFIGTLSVNTCLELN